LAQSFINHPVPFYVDVIINAKAVKTDSSFFCMALNLPLISKEIYLKSRRGGGYSLSNKVLHNLEFNKPTINLF